MTVDTRPLETIERELWEALKPDIANIGRRGKLLKEAQDQLPHGKWYNFLEKFGLTQRTASRYMAVHNFFKSDTVSVLIVPDELANLKLAKAGLYFLAEQKSLPKETIESVFREARNGWVSIDRVKELISDHQAKDDAKGDDAADHAPGAGRSHDDPPDHDDESESPPESDDDVGSDESDGDAPPPEPSLREASEMAVFSEAVDALARLRTKSAIKFVNASLEAETLIQIADFLAAVAALKRKPIGEAA